MKIDVIYVINLKKDTEKLKRIKKRLKDADLLKKTIVFEAIYGKELDKSFYQENNIQIYNDWRDPNSSRPITKGEIGCALSHYFIWQKIVEEKQDNVLIIEDDADFNQNLESFVEKLDVPRNYDLLYFGRKNFDNNEEQCNKDIVKPNFSYWTVGYMLSYIGARKLMESGYDQKIIPVDEFLPIMYEKSNILKYQNNNFMAYATKEKIIKPEPNAFETSETEKSEFYTEIYDSFLLVTVGTDPTDGYKRIKHSLELYGYNYKVLGFGDQWNGGNMAKGPGGGKKIIYLQNFLKNYDGKCKYIVFSDCYDVIALQNPKLLYEKYKKYFDNKIVFSAEKYCWPDENLKDKYPEVNNDFKFLNSGGFIGSVEQIKKLVEKTILPFDDDQLYYTHRFLENQENIVLDYEGKIFQTLSGCSISDFNFDLSKSVFRNQFGNIPTLLHGNGGARDKMLINQISNYFPYKWREIYGYFGKSIQKKSKSVLVSFFALTDNVNESHFKFLDDCIKNRYKIFIYNPKCVKLNRWYNSLQNKNGIVYFHLEDIRSARINSLQIAQAMNCNYYFTTSNEFVLESNIIQKLITRDKNCIGPILRKENTDWTNIWMSVDSKGFYERSFDYIQIIKGERKGIWNCAYINNCFLLKREIYNDAMLGYKNHLNLDVDMSICKYFRDKYIFMFADNLDYYGKVL